MVEITDPRLAPPAKADPVPAIVRVPRLPILKMSEDRAERVSELHFGDEVDVYEQKEKFALIRTRSDHYVGLVKLEALGKPGPEPTHWVSAPLGYAFSQRDLKSAPQTTLFLGSCVTVVETETSYHRIDGIGWVPDVHLKPIGVWLGDPAGIAFQLLGAPYLWGGRDAIGVDCSGLTQVAYAACGTQLPRDSDMQFAWAGEHVAEWSVPGNLQRNDLVFWQGHVGIMLDDTSILHANANHMAVAYEPLEAAIARIAPKYGDPIGAKRVAFPQKDIPAWLKA